MKKPKSLNHELLILITTTLTLTLCLISCGGGGGSGSDTNNPELAEEDILSEEELTEDVSSNEFAGTWLIRKENTSSLWIFNDNGSFVKKRAGEPINGTTHFVGTYSVSNGIMSGNFTNPGVGRGEIKGTIAPDGRLLMDFIEYWHTPPKVVPTVGTRR
ncbi:MAG TPA: hypothetical protein PKA63_00595 [Oligoflexia bacterium]|nr:hypothetical protein [Oligoflexia bacterium]HMP47148.1 hypothetical protein [Oligoflexia bacterium]